MRSITPKEMHLFIGRTIRVAYVKDRGAHGLNFVIDHSITPHVLLRSYDSQSQTLTVERSGGQVESFQYPEEVFAVD